MDAMDTEYIEKLIDDTGRAEVFDRALALGWADGGAPLWVWNQICAEILHERQKRDANAS